MDANGEYDFVFYVSRRHTDLNLKIEECYSIRILILFTILAKFLRKIRYPNLKDFTKVGSCDVDKEQVAYFYDIILFLYRKSHFIFVILITMLGYKKKSWPLLKRRRCTRWFENVVVARTCCGRNLLLWCWCEVKQKSFHNVYH